jgi:hypothetical protein
MSLTSKNAQARLIRTDQKYEPSKKCVDCGLPTHVISVRCLACVEKAWLAEEVAYMCEWLRGHPGGVELAHDSQRLVHLVLWRARQQGWCGGRVSQLHKNRQCVRSLPSLTFPSLAFPPEVKKVCALCLEVYNKGMKP